MNNLSALLIGLCEPGVVKDELRLLRKRPKPREKFVKHANRKTSLVFQLLFSY